MITYCQGNHNTEGLSFTSGNKSGFDLLRACVRDVSVLDVCG